MTGERDRIEAAAAWYTTDQLSFDRALVRFRFDSLKPYLVGTRGLELGSAEGEMTGPLAERFPELTVVDASPTLLGQIPDRAGVRKICSLFEDLAMDETYDSIVMEHVLEHVMDPGALLRRAKSWLAPGGRILAGVPNGHSFHRLVAVKMGLLDDPCDLNDRDVALGHRRVYTMESFRLELEAAGLEVMHTGGVFFKPLSNAQIDSQWTAEMIDGFGQLGADFPDNAAEIFAVCVRR